MFKLLTYIYSVPTRFIMENQQQNTEFTQAEIDERREKLSSFYDSVIPHLEKQLKYEELRGSIEIAKLKYLQAQIAMANLMNPEPEEEEEDDEPTTRTLKRNK